MNTEQIDDRNINIRPLKVEDIKQAMELSYSEGWNQTEKDWKLLIENPYNTSLAAESGGRIIGTSTALNHSDNIAWIGMVIVDKAFRGRGIGKLLMNEIIKKLVHFQSVKLDATPAGLPLYTKLGFISEYIIERMVNLSISDNSFSENDTRAEKLVCTDYSVMLKMDERVFGTSRSYLIGKLFSLYPDKAYKMDRNNVLDGYLLGRDGIKYNYLGPLVASSDESARILLGKALGSLTGKPVVLDILKDKEKIISWLGSLGFQKQRSFTRMYLGNNVYKGIPENYYLISGPEYG